MRTLLLVATAWAVLCSVAKLVGHLDWLPPLLRAAAVLGLCAAIIAQLCKPGRKLKGILSVAAIVVFHAMAWLSYGRSSGPSPLWEEYVVLATVVALVATWFCLALSAVRTHQSPNRAIGLLSLLFLLSPVVLDFLDAVQDRFCHFAGIPYQQFKPFVFLIRVLWGV